MRYSLLLPILVCALAPTTPAAAIADQTQDAHFPLEVASELTRVVTLDEVIARALAQSPRLQAFSNGIGAARGDHEQAGAWPNPEIDAGIENFAGSGAYGSFTSAEINYSISQEIPMTGKLSARQAITTAALDLAKLDAVAARRDIIRDATAAFMTVVAAEASVELATEQKELAADVLRAVKQRVGAAASPLIQKSRSEVESASAAIALNKANHERAVARQALAAIVGEDTFEQPVARAAFFAITKPDPLPVLTSSQTLIDTQRRNSALTQARARIDLEKANALPDPRVSVGVREFQATGDRAVLVSLGLPIPVFNANGGGIEKARQDALRTERDNHQAALDRVADLARVHARAMRSYAEASTLKASILPSATQAFRLARDGYAAGRFPYFEVLDAQRSLFLARQQQIDALREFHVAQAEVARLIAKVSSEPSQSGEDHVE
mgnify:CR=1 FL=1